MKLRGQWGERMAEDILRLAGFMEGINYQKQKALETDRNRPDFTFFLPQHLKVNMDVKFPLTNYLHFLESESAQDKESYREKFLKDVKQRIKEVQDRNYINPEENTVDYVLVFIPNEQVYGFIHENNPQLLDEAMRQKVILCSPLTLYAILAVMRQAIDNFQLEKTSARILSLLGTFGRQWELFVKSFDQLDKRLSDAAEEMNKLKTTRRSQLEKPLEEIAFLRKQGGLEASSGTKETTDADAAPGREES